jgi:hypothetical protein
MTITYTHTRGWTHDGAKRRPVVLWLSWSHTVENKKIFFEMSVYYTPEIILCSKNCDKKLFTTELPMVSFAYV